MPPAKMLKENQAHVFATEPKSGKLYYIRDMELFPFPLNIWNYFYQQKD